MKRDWNLIFDILTYAEEHANANSNHASIPEFENFTREQVLEHVLLCEEAGYLETVRFDSPLGLVIFRLKWFGHQTLERMRKERSKPKRNE